LSGNVITETLLGFAFERPVERERIDAALGRVEAHYSPQLAEPPPLRASLGNREGLALWRNDGGGSSWPAWAQDGDVVVASSAAPGGWPRLAGDVAPAAGAIALAREVAKRPERIAELAPPFVLAIRDATAEELVIVNDFAGAGRIYELEFAGDGFGSPGVVWSNRLGALPIFAAVAPKADEHAWELFAAAGWFIGETTPIAGAVKLPGGSVVRAGAGLAGAERRSSGAIEGLVSPRQVAFGEALDAASRDTVDLVRGVAGAASKTLAVDLSGGRDSRVSAAATFAAGVTAKFRTGDNHPGELELVERLLGDAEHDVAKHNVTKGERKEPADELAERLAAIHLVHDGMRNPQELRRPTRLPLPSTSPRPTLSGHGGEIAHGFYYPNARKLRGLERRGERALRNRLEKAGKRNAAAATQRAYAAYRAELERLLDEGRALGLEGPTLLDYFYLTQRLAHRSGLGSRSGRYSCCVAPGFVRAAFDLTPEERVQARLHSELIAKLMPEWRDIPFFAEPKRGPMPALKRARIWEKPAHAAALDEIIRKGKSWPAIFRKRRVRKMWREIGKGEGHHHYEGVFDRIIWRETYDEHLATLARAAKS
jgi:hypothetical protein